MADDKPPMPPQPTTKAFTAPDKQELLHAELKALVTSFRDSTEERFNRQDATLMKQDATLQTLADNELKSEARMTRMEVRLEDLETGRGKLSGGVRQLSQSDDGQNVQIASLSVKVDALTVSQGIQTKLIREAAEDIKKFLATPTVKVIGAALLGFFAKWIATKFGIELPS